MRHDTDFPRPILELADQRIPMRDGVMLSCRLWRPRDAEADPVPAILEHLPYRKRDGTIARDETMHPWMAGQGYACLRVDMRGNGDSPGLMADEYTRQELDDACDVIAWVRTQPWCSGAVGMQGISWGGFNALQVAALRPEGLRAVISICATADRFADDIHYKGGCLMGSNFGWASQMLAYSARPPDPAIVGEGWREMWLTRLAAQPFHLSDWLRHQRRDAYWRHGSICEDYAAIEAAVLSIGGWHDGYRNTPATLLANLHAPVKAIVGPWNHKYPHLAAPRPAIGYLQEARRWWDHWLKGLDSGVQGDPPMRAWLMDALPPARKFDARPGRWIAGDWPMGAPETWHLAASGLAAAPSEFSTDIASPADCGAGAGAYFPFHYAEELPGEQSGDDAGAACFDSPEGTAARDIVGAPVVTLRLRSDTGQGQLIARLCDLAPDGTSALITWGCLNLTHRAGAADPRAMVPGEDVEVTLRLDQIAYRLPAGHRLRLALSTAYWPMLWPAPAPARLTLTQGRLAVPLRPLADGDEWTFREPLGSGPWDAEALAPSRYDRAEVVDPATGIRHLTITHDNGHNRDRAHGLETWSRSTEDWRIHPDDPLSADARITWDSGMARGDWGVWIRCTSRMRASATQYHITARIEAHEGEALVFQRQFDDSIARDMG